MDQEGHWRLAPAYDITYIFNTGGYLPEEERCLMIKGKLINITKSDILDFASDNGIRRAESIINEVVNALFSFRFLAEKNEVQDSWIGRIEMTLTSHLKDWGYASAATNFTYMDNNGRAISNAHVEQAYKGNYHLLATIDGKSRRYIIRKETNEANEINRIGIMNLREDFIRQLIRNFLK
jgi:serine/threonine-protein kinase HipA